MRKLFFLAHILLLLTLVSCVRAPVKPGTLEPLSVEPRSVITSPEALRSNVFHEVAPGETLWRISKMYDVDMETIISANALRDPSKLEKGERLRIPNAAPFRSVIPLYPSQKWQYIIVHHSATEVGNALSFDYQHIKNRNWKCIGYDFVIDNGTAGKEDGQIEVSPRWVNQEDGAHCKADNMNYRGIGICLVGNFNEEAVTASQMRSLVFLVKTLKDYYRVPNSRILGHGQVKGAKTDCPGKKFPWKEFHEGLNTR